MVHFVQIPPNPERSLESARLLAAPAPVAATRVSVSFARVGQLRLSWGRDLVRSSGRLGRRVTQWLFRGVSVSGPFFWQCGRGQLSMWADGGRRWKKDFLTSSGRISSENWSLRRWKGASGWFFVKYKSVELKLFFMALLRTGKLSIEPTNMHNCKFWCKFQLENQIARMILNLFCHQDANMCVMDKIIIFVPFLFAKIYQRIPIIIPKQKIQQFWNVDFYPFPNVFLNSRFHPFPIHSPMVHTKNKATLSIADEAWDWHWKYYWCYMQGTYLYI